jgi:predicted ArsR family transcriptional regulator
VPTKAPSQHLASGSFTATVSAISDAFGDPTRRGIYLRLRESGDGLTAAQVAESFGVHPNVARHHLDKLAAGGYVEVTVDRTAGAGAGRPSKRYRSVDSAAVDVPVRADDLVLALLGRALAKLPAGEVETMAEEIGAEYGTAMAVGMVGPDVNAGQRSLRSAMQAVADALTAHGFAAHTENRNNQLRIVNNHCPFGDVAIDHPVVCAVDRGLVRGMLSALYGATEVSTEASVAHGDSFCATAV